MYKVKRPLLLLLICLLAHNLFAQDKHLTDSLSARLKTTPSDSARARLYYKLMMAVIDADSTATVEYAANGIVLAAKSNAAKITADIQNNLGTFYNYRGNRAKSDSLIKSALKIRLTIRDSMGAAYSLMNLGHNNYDQNNFVPALNYYTQAARIRQLINDEKGLSGSYIWIGNVYLEGVINYPLALSYYQKALDISLQTGDELNQSYIYSNMANVFMYQKKYGESLKYNLQSLRIKQKLHNVRGLGVLYSNIGNLYFYNGKFSQSMGYYSRSLAIREQQGDRVGIATSYVNIANVYRQQGNLQKAEEMLLKAVELSKTLNFKQGLRDAYQALFDVNNDKKQYVSAIAYYRLYDNYKDSILNETSARQTAEIQTKYETEKKEQQINILHNQSVIQQLQINKRNTTIIIICIIFIVAVAFGYLFYNRYRLQQVAILQNAVIRQQDLATKGIIDAEENERKRIAGDLHDGVGQLLSATRMNLDILLERMKQTDDENLDLAFKTMAMVDESCKEVRTIAHQMMPNVLLKMGLVSALRDFVNKIDSHRLKIVLETSGLENRLNNNVEVVLYRVIQETVNNVIKHAKATLLDVQLMMEGGEVSVTIEDNGVGFDTSDREQFEGIGLKNIITRVEYLKGTVDISSSPGAGALVAILIPLN
jgi:two-component system NarL family sensor kinase